MINNIKKTYYYDISLQELAEIKKENKRPTLALHACCAPCSCFPLEFLTPYFDVTILYYNPNIYPEEEYLKRLNELKKYLEIFNKEHNQNVKLEIFNYDNEEYMKDLQPLKDEHEGGKRCFLCYEKRMDLTYAYADKKGFDYFTTVMTISRQKNSFKLNEIGLKLSKKYKPKYFISDFKKHKGIDRATDLRKQYNLYNQLYCGCIYSYEEYLKKNIDK